MKNITEKLIKETLEDMLYKPNPKTGVAMFVKLPEGFNLDDQIKNGFAYQFTAGTMVLSTGFGGVKELIKTQREAGLPDEAIAAGLKVWTGHSWLDIVDAKFTPRI